MEFKELVWARRSIRKFLPTPIALEDVRDMIATATQAANSGNRQNWEFLIIQNSAMKNAIAETVRRKAERLLAECERATGEKTTYEPQEFYLEAPVLVGVVATGIYHTKPDLLMLSAGYGEQAVNDIRCRGDMQTIGAVVQLLLLAAWEKGYASCWMTGPLFARKELEELLRISPGNQLSALIPIGLPGIMPPKTGRKPVDDVIRLV